jgi:hypothetical protein
MSTILAIDLGKYNSVLVRAPPLRPLERGQGLERLDEPAGQLRGGGVWSRSSA